MTFSPITLGSGLAGYNYLARTRDSQQAIFDRSPVIARDVAAVREKLVSVQTSQQLMEDRKQQRGAMVFSDVVAPTKEGFRGGLPAPVQFRQYRH